jgi:hypothetical protein
VPLLRAVGLRKDDYKKGRSCLLDAGQLLQLLTSSMPVLAYTDWISVDACFALGPVRPTTFAIPQSRSTRVQSPWV